MFDFDKILTDFVASMALGKITVRHQVDGLCIVKAASVDALYVRTPHGEHYDWRPISEFTLVNTPKENEED